MMKRILAIFTNSNFWPLIIIIFFAILAGRSLIFQSGYFNMHDDLQMMRQLQLEKCLLDSQIPCRWVPDLGFGFGFPLFNFYPPLPYLIGEIFRVIQISFVNTAKLTFALSFVVSGITMYYLAKEFFGRLGGTLSAIFYIWAPYHAVDIYVRGAMNEAWALAWFPLLFWAAYKLVISKNKRVVNWIIVLALGWFALLTSHNLMVIMIVPFFAVWVLLHLWREKKWKKIIPLFLSGIWALGLSAFFTFPALFENKFTQIRGQLVGYYDYTAHFVTIKQLFISRFWGHGASVWGIEDGMPFQIGHINWLLALAIGVYLFVRLVRQLRKKSGLLKTIKKDQILLVTAFFILVGFGAAFMTHSRSVQIYLALGYLRFVQFPWRFLALVIFAFSFAVGIIPGIFAEWKKGHRLFARIVATGPQILIVVFLILLLLIMNWTYFRPEGGKMGPLTDEQKFSGLAWEYQQTSGIYDYLPAQAKMAPNSAQDELAEFMDGEGAIDNASQGTYWAKFNIVANSDSRVRINIFDFPNWRVFVDGVETEIILPEEEAWGRIWINIPKGEHQVYAQFHNTPIRTVSNLVSLVSWVLLLSFPLWKRKLR